MNEQKLLKTEVDSLKQVNNNLSLKIVELENQNLLLKNQLVKGKIGK